MPTAKLPLSPLTEVFGRVKKYFSSLQRWPSGRLHPYYLLWLGVPLFLSENLDINANVLHSNVSCAVLLSPFDQLSILKNNLKYYCSATVSTIEAFFGGEGVSLIKSLLL